MKLDNKVYEILKWLVVILIPAVATFYTHLAASFGWPAGEEVSQFANELCLLIGTIIGISTASYYKAEKDKLEINVPRD